MVMGTPKTYKKLGFRVKFTILDLETVKFKHIEKLGNFKYWEIIG